jgi:hypothetical protein
MKRRRYHSLDDFLPPRMRERILLWVLTPFPTFVALMFVYDLLDGRTRLTSDGAVTLWEKPGAFAMATGVCLLFCIVAAMFWLALINNLNEEWLPPKLRNRPHLALVALIFATVGAVFLGRELLTGEITLSGRARVIGRHLSVGQTPIRFALACLVYLGFCAGIAFGWFLALKRWMSGSKHRWRPAFSDPSKRGRML